jgi:hypothetical protein
MPVRAAGWQAPVPENGGRAALWENYQITEPEKVPDWQQVADELLPEIEQIVVHKAHLLTQPFGKTITGLLLKYKHQAWMLKKQHQNY